MKFYIAPTSPAPRSGSRFPAVRASLAIGLLAALGACGGGGGGGGGTAPATAPVTPVTPVTPGVTTYPLLAGFRALIQAGSVDNFTVSGDCAGTAQTSNGAATPAVFETTTGFSTAERATLSLPNCSTTVTSSSGTNYYDANFAPLGTVNANGNYTSAAGGAIALPASVKVGDAQAIYFVYNGYADSTKTTRTGQVVEGYAIEADTANASANPPTVIYHATSKVYDNGNSLQSTTQTFYRMTTTGTLTLLSLDVVYSGNLFGSHLVYTRTN